MICSIFVVYLLFRKVIKFNKLQLILFNSITLLSILYYVPYFFYELNKQLISDVNSNQLYIISNSITNVSFVQLISYIVDSLQPGTVPTSEEFGQYFSKYLAEGEDLNRTLIPAAIVVIATARGFGTFVGNYFISYVSYYLVHNLRTELFDRLLTLPSAFYDKHAMGHLVAKITYHVTQVTGAATDAVRTIIREGFTVIAYLGFLLYLNWRLTLIFFAVAPLIALLVGTSLYCR